MLQSFAQYVIVQPNELAGEAVGDKQSEFDINCKIDGKIAKLPNDIASLTPAEMWGKFFLYASDKDNQDFVIELTKHNRGIAMAFTVLKNVSQDELNWYHETRYWMHVSDELSMKEAARREGHASGLAEGRTAGLAEGRQEKAVETARNLLVKGINPEIIAECTGLPLEQVGELASQHC